VRIQGIEIHDTYGCRDFKVGPFSLVRVTGQNGSGKSSILRALSYLFEGGTDPTVIRKGAEQSVVRSTSTTVRSSSRPRAPSVRGAAGKSRVMSRTSNGRNPMARPARRHRPPSTNSDRSWLSIPRSCCASTPPPRRAGARSPRNS
jgi:energy-coupling factor transporter ATP-binding protein EcfA2